MLCSTWNTSPPTSTSAVIGSASAQCAPSMFPRTTNVGARLRSASITSGAPTSPAWMMRSAPLSAAIASGRSNPWVSEMTPTRISSPGMTSLDLCWHGSDFFSTLRVDQNLGGTRNGIGRPTGTAGLANGIGAFHQHDQRLRKRLGVLRTSRLGKLAQSTPELLLVARDDRAGRVLRVAQFRRQIDKRTAAIALVSDTRLQLLEQAIELLARTAGVALHQRV